jgi:hypothetical protein
VVVSGNDGAERSGVMSSAVQLPPDPSDGNNRSQVLTEMELERYRDAEWAMNDPDVQRRFRGEWIVAYGRNVVAHGSDPKAVLDHANRIAAVDHRLVLCAGDESDSWLNHTSDMSGDFSHA